MLYISGTSSGSVRGRHGGCTRGDVAIPDRTCDLLDCARLPNTRGKRLGECVASWGRNDQQNPVPSGAKREQLRIARCEPRRASRGPACDVERRLKALRAVCSKGFRHPKVRRMGRPSLTTVAG